MSEEFVGYKGKALEVLKKAEAEIGDIIQITKNKQVYKGLLIPRSEYSDDEHIVIKMKTGYNVGIRITPNIRIKKAGKGVKPAFTQPPLPKQKQDLPKVAIVSTGGTIASRVDYRTGAVRPALSANDLYSVVPELADIARIDAEILFSQFSENIKAGHWREMAEAVAKHVKNGAAGVVIAHGTDTMAYTAAALSFALQDLPVPVLLVGSQRSADRPSSDAAANLVAAVKAASKAPFAEVVIAMHGTTSDMSTLFHRGTKVRKCHTSRRDTFKSINASPLARMENDEIIMLMENYCNRNEERKLILKPNFDEKVALLKFHPGLHPEILRWFVNQGYRGIVLEGTGLGHVGKYCLTAVKEALQNKVLVAMTSQCLWGRVNMHVYDQARDLLAMGVIPLEDMLPETALVKMMWVFGQTKNLGEAKKLLSMNIAHEVSPRTVYED